MPQPPNSRAVTIDYKGKTYKGSVTSTPKLVTVDSAWGSKSAVPHASGADVLAPMMLRELVQEAIARGELAP